MFKINYSLNGIKRWISPDKVWWYKNYGKFALCFSLVLLTLVMCTGCNIGMEDTVETKPVAQTCFPIILEGNVDMPGHEERILSRDRELVTNGFGVQVTNDSTIDTERNNRVGGGGAPDGGMWLAGSYHFEIDANGQQIPEKSWLKLFSDTQYPVTGGVTANCDIAMGSIGGVDIRGKIADGRSTGKVMHGDGKVHIYGNMVGIARP